MNLVIDRVIVVRFEEIYLEPEPILSLYAFRHRIRMRVANWSLSLWLMHRLCLMYPLFGRRQFNVFCG